MSRIFSRRGCVLVLLLALALAAGGWVAWETCLFLDCPDVAELAALEPGEESVLTSRDGTAFAELRPRRKESIPLAELPAYLPEAFLASEDKRFRQHDGIDWRRIAGAGLATLRGDPEGGSTLTMQLARTLFPEALPREEKTLRRKLLEMRTAEEIEDRYSKDEILELYLNHVYLGRANHGVAAAAEEMFDTEAQELTLPQAALLAALPPAPAHYDPFRHPETARERRDLVLQLMADQGRITPEEAAEAREAPLGVREGRMAQDEPGEAPYFAARVRDELDDLFGRRIYKEPVRVVTTLDLGLQEAASRALVRQIRSIESGAYGTFRGAAPEAEDAEAREGSPNLQGAIAALSVDTGDVLAWVGGRDYETSPFDRAAGARRQAGSTFKPFVYAAAIGSGHSFGEPLEDTPLTVELDDGSTYSPRNFSRGFEGSVTAREALVRSKNVPTVRLATEVGLARVAALAEEVGIEGPVEPNPSMALGAEEVSPIELATAYTAFAGLGERPEPRFVLRVETREGRVLWEARAPERRRVLEPAVAYVLVDALQEVVDRGTGTAVRAAGYRGSALGKTGTTNERTDVWFVGATPRVAAAVWLGFDQPRPIVDRATGGRLAAPVWGRMMARWPGSRDGGGWTRPPGVVEERTDPTTGRPLAEDCAYVGGTRELFVRAAMPPPSCPTETSLAGRFYDDTRYRDDTGYYGELGLGEPTDEEGTREFRLPGEDEGLERELGGEARSFEDRPAGREEAGRDRPRETAPRREERRPERERRDREPPPAEPREDEPPPAQAPPPPPPEPPPPPPPEPPPPPPPESPPPPPPPESPPPPPPEPAEPGEDAPLLEIPAPPPEEPPTSR